MAVYSSSSPYYGTPDTGAYLDIMTFRNIPNDTTDVKFEVTAKYVYRPDLLAYDLYANSGLWWVFAVRNKDVIKDPIYDMTAGQMIYLPKMSTMRTALGI